VDRRGSGCRGIPADPQGGGGHRALHLLDRIGRGFQRVDEESHPGVLTEGVPACGRRSSSAPAGVQEGNSPLSPREKRGGTHYLFRPTTPSVRSNPITAAAMPPKMYHIVWWVKRPRNALLRLSPRERDATTPTMIKTIPAINRTTPTIRVVLIL
jgi:hypothetical protein